MNSDYIKKFSSSKTENVFFYMFSYSIRAFFIYKNL